jgi:hypothetical protein
LRVAGCGEAGRQAGEERRGEERGKFKIDKFNFLSFV